MEIYQLKVFLAVARCLNFTEAAESLNLTQPAVSAKIKTLESELKASLFHRLGRQIQLTDVGHYLVKEAEKLIELEAEVSYKIQEFQQDNFNKLTIGCSLGLAHSWLPKIIYQYRHRHPEIDLKLEVFNDSQLLEEIAQNNIDLGFSELKLTGNPNLNSRKVGSIQYGLILAPDRPLAKKDWYRLIDIKQKPLLLLSDRFASYRVFVSRLAELNLELTDFPQIEIVDSINLMRTYLTEGDYLGFASNLEFQLELDAKILTTVNLQEFALPADIYVCFNQNQTKVLDKRQITPVDKFLALFPADSVGETPIMLNRDCNSTEIITIDLGVQNSTIPTIAAGLIVQRLRLLEQFLPRTGRYASVKYDIRWHNFLSGMPIVEGLQNRQLDIGILGDYPLLQSAIPQDNYDSSTRLVSFVSIDPDGGGNAVIVPQASKLETIEDLKGETIALPFGSSVHGMLLRNLSDLGLLSEVQFFPLKNSQLTTPINSRIAAGYAYFSPFHQMKCDRGNFKYLSDGNLSQLPGFYGVVVSQSFADKYPELIVSYLQTLLAAQNWLSSTPSAISLVSKWTKIKPKILTNILSLNTSKHGSSLFINDSQIRPDWLSNHLDRLKAVPQLKSVHEIKLDRWIQLEFLQTARQN